MCWLHNAFYKCVQHFFEMEEENMKSKYIDPRVSRTRELIQEALIELIEEKGFEAITVKDLTTKANINRGTFYAHYQDKYDLMEKCQEQFMQQMTEIAKRYYPDVEDELNNQSEFMAPLSLFISIFENLDENSSFITAVLSPKGDVTFQIKLKDFLWKTIFNNSHGLIKEEKILVPEQYLVSYIVSAHIGVIQQWLNEGRKESPRKMAQILSTMTTKGPFFAAGLKEMYQTDNNQ